MPKSNKKAYGSGTHVTPSDKLGGTSSKKVTTLNPIVSVGRISPQVTTGSTKKR